jgi:hypothetical protein
MTRQEKAGLLKPSVTGQQRQAASLIFPFALSRVANTNESVNWLVNLAPCQRGEWWRVTP